MGKTIILCILLLITLRCGPSVNPLPDTVFCTTEIPHDMADAVKCMPCVITYCNGVEGPPCFNCPSEQVCLPRDMGHCCGYAPQNNPPVCKPAVKGSP